MEGVLEKNKRAIEKRKIYSKVRTSNILGFV